MRGLALLLSLLALGALGLVACGGGDDAETTAASESETTFDELAADNQPCNTFLGRWRLAVIEGDISCRTARRVMNDWADERLPGSWRCTGPEANVVCTKKPGRSSRAGVSSRLAITARLVSEDGPVLGGTHHGHHPYTVAVTEADPANNNRLSDEQLITRRGNEWAPLFAEGGYAPSLCSYMGQPACERMGCERVGNRPIKNCTPVSAEFRESFADATVERVRVQDHYAYAEFTNGESVEFADKNSAWFITLGLVHPGNVDQDREQGVTSTP